MEKLLWGYLHPKRLRQRADLVPHEQEVEQLLILVLLVASERSTVVSIAKAFNFSNSGFASREVLGLVG